MLNVVSKPGMPRERMESVGRENLADCELVALVLGTGTRDESVLALGQRMLDNLGGLSGLASSSLSELRKIKGLGPARAARLAASFELGLRMTRSCQPKRRRLSSPDEVVQMMGRELVFLQRENFFVISLGARNDVLSVDNVAVGSRDACMIDGRQIFGKALSRGASSIILVHNHPSGDPSPSKEDLALTRRSIEGGRFLGIEVLDHVIIAAQGYSSLREEAWQGA